MDKTNEFAERYKKMSNSELMEVLQNPSHYQPSALSVARSVFASRQLSEIEIKEAKQFLLSEKRKKEKQHEKIEAAKAKVTDAGNALLDTVNPIQTTTASAEKYIRLITLAFTGILIYKIIVNLDLFSAIATGDSHEFFGYTLYIFPVLVELIAVLLFWLRKQSGWILLAAFCSFSVIGNLHGLYYAILLQFKESTFLNFFPAPSPVAYIISILFYLGTFLVLKKQDIREIYKINKQRIQNSVIIGAITGAIFLFLLLSY
jgi:hypothetical protein